MATKKSTIVIISILTLVVGYVLGGIIGIPPTNLDRIPGDIGKVNKHKSDVVNENEALLEQKLRTDSTFMAQTTYTLAFISARIGEFKENAALTSEVVADYPQVQQYQQSMSDLAAVAANAEVSAASALEALTKISLGQEGGSYEEFSNNAILSYLLLEKGLTTATNFINDVDAFLKGKKIEDYQSLAFVRDIWVNYNLVTAVLNEDNALVNYWNKAGHKLTTDKSKLGIWNTTSADFQNNVTLAAFFNAQILGSASEKLNLVNATERLGESVHMNGNSINFNEQIWGIVIIQNNGKIGLWNNNNTNLESQSQVSMCMFPADLHANVAIAMNATLEANTNNLGIFNLSKNSLGNGAQISGAISNSQLIGLWANQSTLSAVFGKN